MLVKDPVLCMDIVSSFSHGGPLIGIIGEKDHKTKQGRSSALLVAGQGVQEMLMIYLNCPITNKGLYQP